MTDTIIKPVVNLDWMDAPIESDKWRNLIFLKNGKIHRGHAIHPTEEAAANIMRKDEKEILEDQKAFYKSVDGVFQGYEYSHAIQMPVKE